MHETLIAQARPTLHKVWDVIHVEDLEGTKHACHADERGKHDALAGGHCRPPLAQWPHPRRTWNSIADHRPESQRPDRMTMTQIWLWEA
jgi:hypothetical protein